MDNAKTFSEKMALANIAAYQVYRKTKDVDLSDLLQVARMALWQGILSYDESRGDFDKYVCARMKYSLWDEVRNAKRYHRNGERICFVDADKTVLSEKDTNGDELLDFISILPNKEKYVISQYYLLGISTVEIAKNLKVTRPYISQLLTRAKNILKAELVGGY